MNSGIAKKAEDKHEKALLKAYTNSLDDQEQHLNDKSIRNDMQSAFTMQTQKKLIESADKAAKGLGYIGKIDNSSGYTQLGLNSISDYPKNYSNWDKAS